MKNAVVQAAVFVAVVMTAVCAAMALVTWSST